MKKQIRLRQYANAICELFEDILEKHNICIPDGDREVNEEEACLYGCTYFDLEQDVVGVLDKLVDEVDPQHNIERIIDEY